MNIVSVKLRIKEGVDVELSLDEVRQLRDELNSLVEKQTQFVPSILPFPCYPPSYPLTPWRYVYGTTTSDGTEITWTTNNQPTWIKANNLNPGEPVSVFTAGGNTGGTKAEFAQLFARTPEEAKAEARERMVAQIRKSAEQNSPRKTVSSHSNGITLQCELTASESDARRSVSSVSNSVAGREVILNTFRPMAGSPF